VLHIVVPRGHRSGEAAFVADPRVRDRIGKAKARRRGERDHPPAGGSDEPRGGRRDAAAVETGAEVAADQRLGTAQPGAGGAIELLAERLDIIGFVRVADLAERELPILAARQMVAADGQLLAGRDPLHAFEEGRRAVAADIGDERRQLALVEPTRDFGERVEALRHRCEGDQAAGAVIMERALTGRVARQHQRLLACVPDREGEVAEDTVESRLPFPEPDAEQDFGVAELSRRSLAEPVQQFVPIVDADVGREHPAAGLVDQRLPVETVFRQEPIKGAAERDLANRAHGLMVRAIDALRLDHRRGGGFHLRRTSERP
jgi:hypothetical protein